MRTCHVAFSGVWVLAAILGCGGSVQTAARGPSADDFGLRLTVPAGFVRTDAADAEKRMQYARDAVPGIREPLEVMSYRRDGPDGRSRVSVYAYPTSPAETLAGVRQSYVQADRIDIVGEERVEVVLSGAPFEGFRYDVALSDGAHIHQTVLATARAPGTLLLSATHGTRQGLAGLEEILYTATLSPP